MELYAYEPLGQKSQIRILQLLPGSYDDPLAGYLGPVNLDTHPSYKCLSYTWGEPTFTRSIEIEGKELHITPNLDAAIRRVRACDDYISIWIDAICIDQANLLERNHQVSLMRRIYSECEECVIYLGENCDNSEIVPEFLRKLFNGWNGLYKEGLRPGDTVMALFHERYPSIPTKDDPGWYAFRLFMTRPWFRRVWIVQEFALPRKVKMMCGTWIIDATFPGIIMHLHQMTEISYLMCKLGSPVLEQLSNRGMDLVVHHLRMRVRCGNFAGLLGNITAGRPIPRPILRPLYYLLDMVRRCDSHDPRDRIYGVLGLATYIDGSSLEVNYAKGLAEIGLDVAGYLIKQGNGYKMLQSVQGPACIHYEWPSWLPVWTSGEPYFLHPGKRKRLDIPDHQAHIHLPAFRLEYDQSTLIVKGFFLDVIEELASKRERSKDSSELMPVTNAELRQIESMVADSRVLRSDQKQPDSLWRTIIGNSTHYGVSPVPPDYGIKYEHFREMQLRLETAAKGKAQRLEVGEVIDLFTTRYQDFIEFGLGWIGNRDARFSITKSGMMALVPRDAEIGDIIFTVLGDPDHRTYIVRRKADSDYHTWIGESYVHCVLGDEYHEIEEGTPCEITVR